MPGGMNGRSSAAGPGAGGSSPRRRALKWRLLSLAVAAVVALFLLLPASAFGVAEDALRWLAGLLGSDARRMATGLPWDQIVHGFLFAVLAWVWCRLPARTGRRRGVLAAAAAAVVYGGALELSQMLLGYRAGEWTDLVADAIGVAVGAVVASRRLARGRRRAADES